MGRYFDDLFALYDGHYASGKSWHGMDHYAKKAKQPAVAAFSPMVDVPDSQHESPVSTLPAPDASCLNFEVGEAGSRDYTNWFGTDAFSPVSNLGNGSTFLDSEGAHGLHSSNQVLPQISQSPCFNSKPSGSTSQVAGTKRLKRKKSSTSTSTEDFHERFLKLKKEEIDRFVAIEERKMEDPYSIQKCVRTVEGMADLLQVEDMIKAADIFKENPVNKEDFLSFSTNELQLGWLRKQI